MILRLNSFEGLFCGKLTEEKYSSNIMRMLIFRGFSGFCV